jgi:hypothetical protein
MSRRLRTKFRLISAVGIGAVMSILGAATALANHGPGPWP